MNVNQIKQFKTIRTALLIAGSAFCICSCTRKVTIDDETNEGLMTQQAFDLTIIESTNGKLANRFETPLMETYEYAREPYREFRKGIKVTTYDSETNEIESTLIADYAIQFLNQQLWEAKGNVVATNAKGHVLETQQLFWNQRTERIYSNIDSRITQGTDVIIGVGFESDEQFMDWEFRRPRGTVDVDVESAKTPGNEPENSPEEGVETDGEPEPTERPATRQPAETTVETSSSGQSTVPDLRETKAENETMLRRMNHRADRQAGTMEKEAVEEVERVQLSSD